MKHAQSPLVKSASRALDVLEAIASAPESPQFTELSESLKIPRSSLFYLLSTLSQRGYIALGEGKEGYVLGPTLALLADKALASGVLFKKVESLVETVGKELNETVSFMERKGDEMEFRFCHLARRRLIAVQEVGQRAPLYAFSGGKIVLADMSEAELDAYFARTKFRQITGATHTSERQVRRDVEEVRKTGFGIVRDEHGEGISAVSIGLRMHGQLIGTLGVAMASIRFTEEALDRAKTALAQAAEKLTLSSEEPVA